MKRRYPYLRDPRVLSEIRKHQWIESEKSGKEIGFGTAAIDWITKYGELWRQAHAAAGMNADILLEQRKFRRFPLQSFATLLHNGKTIPVKTIDISSLGMLCQASVRLDLDSPIKIQWSLSEQPDSGITFCGKVARMVSNSASPDTHTLLIIFDRQSRKRIENLALISAGDR